MTQIFFPQNSNIDSQELYCYTNQTGKIVIVKIRGLDDRHCERVVFPGEKFLFEAKDDCELAISYQPSIGIVEDTIPCSQLKQIEKSPK